MPILELQKRARELGRIRTGDKGGKGQPQKLTKFRLTSASKALLDKVAELYGGTVREWTGAGTPQWEVYTDVNRIPILVPPQPVSQWLETWTGGGCVHRCDGVTNALTGDPCDPEDRDHQQAKPTTRLNVVLRDVEGIGVWRLESHGWNAALELPNAAEFLAQAGGYVEGWVALEERISKSDGQTRRFLVPVIEIAVTPAELMSGRGAFGTPSIEGPVQAPALAPGVAALEQSRPDYVALAKAGGNLPAVQEQWRAAYNAGHLDEDLQAALTELGNGFNEQHEPESVDAEVVLDPPDVLWQRCITVAGHLGWDLDRLEKALMSDHDVTAFDATAEQLDAFLTSLEQEAA
jgi:hypothetical protein